MALQMWDGNTGAVAWLQGLLKAAGFDPGPIDGVYGPSTAAAVAAFQSSKGLPATGIDDDTTEGLLAGTSSNPGTPGMSSADIIRSKYPQLSWAQNIPELKAIFDQAVAENWDAARIQGAVSATQWWQATWSTARQWDALVANDPSTALAMRSQKAAQITDMAGSLGVNLSQADMDLLVEDSLRMGLTPDIITDRLVTLGNGAFNPGTITAQQDSLRAQAASYAVPVSESTLATWSQQIAMGMADPAGFTSYLRDQAKSMFPGIAASIDAGYTVRQVAEPYIQTAARELGINPTAVSLADQKWSRALNGVPMQGSTPTAMTLYDWTRLIRNDPSYGYDKTPMAIADATTVKNTLLEAMGYA